MEFVYLLALPQIPYPLGRAKITTRLGRAGKSRAFIEQVSLRQQQWISRPCTERPPRAGPPRARAAVPEMVKLSSNIIPQKKIEAVGCKLAKEQVG